MIDYHVHTSLCNHAEGGMEAYIRKTVDSGYNHPVREIYPSFDIIKNCREQGIRTTLGSDAHKPENVGQHYDKAWPLLLKAGYRHLTTFTRRKRSKVAITNT